ncbi:MAG: hypothetical protein HY786_07410 [Deltaproteobacteria bacterium]|nr:hypothetical protein [Deltaproteobacteria bacterium]
MRSPNIRSLIIPFLSIKNVVGRPNTSVERVFKTVNMRINVGKWSVDGGLNVTKVRLGYYTI